MKRVIITLLLLTLCFTAAAGEEPEQKFASLGDFQLENGEVIRDLNLGYRTVGELNAEQSNAVLFPTWFGGTSKSAAMGFVGPDKLVDSSKYFVILMDALGNGVSSSPSNSRQQPRMRFPQFNIRDMVRAEYEMVTRHMKLRHVRAVIGISMGGMQTFQWVVSYPDFMDKAIPIVGSPQLTSYDLLLWASEVHAIEADPAWRGGEYTSPPAAALTTIGYIQALTVTTPQDRVVRFAPQEFVKSLEEYRQQIQDFDANDRIRQLQAMMAHNVTVPFGGSLGKAAATVHARMLVIVSLHDHMVNPTPALDFARLLFAPTFEYKSDCGHMTIVCELEGIRQATARFLDK